jgi:transcriptional regulator NrdR family protein
MSVFACPIAGCTAPDTIVIATRIRPRKMWRRRKCPNGHRFTTCESQQILDDRFKEPTPLMPAMAH